MLMEFFQGFSITKTKEDQVVEEELTEFGGGECSSDAEGRSYSSRVLSKSMQSSDERNIKKGSIIGWAFIPCVKCNLSECIILYLENVMVKIFDNHRN